MDSTDPDEEESEQLSYWLQSEQPKHAGAGMTQALMNVGCGVAGGVGTLFAAPVIGLREEGATGFVKGIGAGILGAVALPVIGVATACKSLAEGVANTPAAVSASAEGKEWDGQKWRLYDLEQELAEIQAAEGRRRRKVLDTTLYDTLEVDPTASDSAIKKAYYRQALKYHPDKNPTPEAQSKFQAIGQAYQILSTNRRAYDERGMEDQETMDAATFFAMVFGSEAFESYVGELRLASTMKQADFHALQFEQRKRVVTLAKTLADEVLAPYDGDDRAYKAVMKTRADELAGTPFGATLLRVIARVYDTAGQRYLATYADDFFLALRDTAHVAATKFDVVRDAARAVSRTRAAQLAEERVARARKPTDERRVPDVADRARALIVSNTEPDWEVLAFGTSEQARQAWKSVSYSYSAVLFEKVDDEWRPTLEYGLSVDSIKLAVATASSVKDVNAAAAAQISAKTSHKEMMAAVVEAAWRISVVDVENTLRAATHKVLNDHGVNERARLRRAKALTLVAHVFEAAADDSQHTESWQDQLARQINASAGPSPGPTPATP